MEKTSKEFAILVNKMIEIEAKETERAVSEIIKDIAKYYEMEPKELKKILKSIDSPYTLGVNICYYLEGVPIKRTTAIAKYGKIIRNIMKKIKYDDCEDIDFILNYIQWHLTTS